MLGLMWDIILQQSWRIEQIRDAPLASMHFSLLFSHGEQGWHLTFRYQGDATSHTTTEFHVVILFNTDSASSSVATHCSITLQD